MAFVTIRIKEIEGYTRQPLGKDRLVVGRSSDNDLPIKHSSVSREHFALVRQDEDWFVEDLGSANGTFINQDRVATRTRLAEGDRIKAGKARLTFHRGDMNAADPAIELQNAAADFAVSEAAGPQQPEPDQSSMGCAKCGGGFSIAHRPRGDSQPCPRCGHLHTVR